MAHSLRMTRSTTLALSRFRLARAPRPAPISWLARHQWHSLSVWLALRERLTHSLWLALYAWHSLLEWLAPMTRYSPSGWLAPGSWRSRHKWLALFDWLSPDRSARSRHLVLSSISGSLGPGGTLVPLGSLAHHGTLGTTTRSSKLVLSIGIGSLRRCGALITTDSLPGLFGTLSSLVRHSLLAAPATRVWCSLLPARLWLAPVVRSSPSRWLALPVWHSRRSVTRSIALAHSWKMARSPG